MLLLRRLYRAILVEIQSQILGCQTSALNSASLIQISLMRVDGYMTDTRRTIEVRGLYLAIAISSHILSIKGATALYSRLRSGDEHPASGPFSTCGGLRAVSMKLCGVVIGRFT